MSEMDTVCKQRFDNKLSLMIENTQNNPWKEVWKSTKDENLANENCLSDNGKLNDTDMLNSRHIVGTPENIATSSSNGNEEAELIETTESTSEISLEGKVAIAEVSSDYPSNAIEIDEDPNEDEACTGDVFKENEDADDPVLITNDESNNPMLNCQSQNENSVKVCEISSCSYFGKPDPLISIEKVDHDSSFDSLCEKGSLIKQDGQSDIVLESDNNMHDDDEDEDNEVLEAPHNTSDIEVEYEKSVRFDHNSTSSRYMHGIKDGRFKSHCKKSESSCDVVQISSSDEEEDDDDDDMEEDNGDDDEESVHSLFTHSKDEPVTKGSPTGDHICSMITMDVLELNISAMKGGPISCFPSHSCIFFKDLSNHVGQEVSREVMVHAQSLESHQWVPMFGGLVLEITLNMTGCHDALMTFFQVPPLKIARCYLRFPPVLLRIYFEARLVDLSLKHNFHQFLNSNLFARSATWHDCKDKSHQMSSFSLPDVRRETVGRTRSTRKLRRAHPYSMKILRSCRTPSKFSYYKPPKWPYLKKVEHYEKKRSDYLKENKDDYGTSNYQTAVTCSSQWAVPPHASQSYYQPQHDYYGRPYLAGREFIDTSSMSLGSFPMSHLQHSTNMGIVSTSHHHHLQSGQWFNRVRPEQQSPVYVTSGFQGTTTKLFTYKPPSSKGGINVTNEDLFCLNDGEYLNDVIIDFYLKYLMEEIASSEDKQRTHVFSSFFYGHLMSGNTQDVSSSNLSPEEQRHAKVKTWTRNVDIFSKDFIIVPINESYHWFLAIICFPNVRGVTKYKSCLDNKKDRAMPDSTHDKSLPEAPSCQWELKIEPVPNVQSDPSRALPDSSSKKPLADGAVKEEEVHEECMDTLPEQLQLESPAACSNNLQTSSESKPMSDDEVTSESTNHPQKPMGSEAAVCEVHMNEEVTKDENDDAIEDDILMEINSECDDDDDAGSPNSNRPEADEIADKPSSESKAEDVTNEEEEKQEVHVEEECNPRNPCILIFDSLKGESRYDVANILRQYLQVEWDQKKCATDGERTFDKSTMKGSMVTCPQQPNSSDCGIYVLQFVESFFLNPIKDFTLPLSLADWFTSKVAMSKRYQLAKLIMKLKDDLHPSLDYDPNSDGCFNIDPILSDEDDDDDGGDDNEEEHSKIDDKEDDSEKKDEKPQSENNDEVDEDNVHDDNKDFPCERHPEVSPVVCSAMSGLDTNEQEAEILSTDEQNK